MIRAVKDRDGTYAAYEQADCGKTKEESISFDVKSLNKVSSLRSIFKKHRTIGSMQKPADWMHSTNFI